MTYLDTSFLIGVVLLSHPQHAECYRIFDATSDRVTCTHALAETFSALTGSYKVPTEVAAELTLGLRERVKVGPLTLIDYETAISEAKRRGVMGGGIYDSLHATYARRCAATRIITRNPGHFQHVAPELQIVVP